MKPSFFSRVTHLPPWGQRMALMTALLAIMVIWSAFSFAPATQAASIPHRSSTPRAASPKSASVVHIGVASYAWSVAIRGHDVSEKFTVKCLNITSMPPKGNILKNIWWEERDGVTLTYFYPHTGYEKPYDCPRHDTNQHQCQYNWPSFDTVGKTAWFNDKKGGCRIGPWP